MKKSSSTRIWIYLAVLILSALSVAGNLTAATLVNLDAGQLKLDIDDKGRFVRLYDSATKRDYLHPSEPSYLMQLKRYSGKKLMAPEKMQLLRKEGNSVFVKLVFDSETSVTLELRQEKGWLHFELKDAESLQEIDGIRWGPYNTTIVGAVGKNFGILHGDKSTVGMMSLEPNTDARCINNGSITLDSPPENCAGWLNYKLNGSYLVLDCIDHTRKRELKNMRSSTPINGLTVKGSKVALYLTPRGKELDLIKSIVIKEKMPYLTLNGVWIKQSNVMRAPSVWSTFGEKNADQVISFCSAIHGNVISSFSRMFANWGHFEIDKGLYPGGVSAVKTTSKKAAAKGIFMNMHTLTNFIKPINKPEPFITPAIDKRFAHYDLTSQLQSELSPDKSEQIAIQASEKLKTFFKSNKDSFSLHTLLQINNEIILFKNVEIRGDSIVFMNCQRGYLMTKSGPHPAGNKVQFMYYSGYKCLFAGTMPMLLEVAENVADVVNRCKIRKVSLDGHESCMVTGQGAYAMNAVMKRIYEKNRNREMIYTSSRISNYCWNMLGYLSWGEFDKAKGFRGTMLDYRIRRQIQLECNLIPHKLGQHYPSRATLEDINWLMAQAIGWDGGVELSIDFNEFNKNRQKDEITEAIAKWEMARRSGTVTDLQKLKCAQIDRVYDIVPTGQVWQLKVIRKRWTDPRCSVLPSSVIKLKSLSGGQPQKSTVDLSWTHNPLIYKAAAVSDDIPMGSGIKNIWQITYPEAGAKSSNICGNQLKLILRVPANAPCGISNPLISVNNGQTFMIPVSLKPGEYIATPLNAPVAFIYNANHEVIGKATIRYSNTLPNMQGKVTFKLECSFDSIDKNKKSFAVMNMFYSQVL